MRLLYAFPESYPLPRARGVQVAHALCSLAEAGVDIDFAFVPADASARKEPFAFYSRSLPANLHPIPLKRALPWPLSALESNRVFAAHLKRHISRTPANIVVVRHLRLAELILPHIHAPLVYEAHEVFADTAMSKRRTRVAALEADIISQARMVITNTAATADRLAERYGYRDKMHVLHNGVNWPESIPDKQWNDAANRIVYAGSFFPWKGVSELVDAASSIPACRVTLLGGDEAEVASMRQRAKAQDGKFVFSGRVPHATVADTLADSCIAVLPNRPEPDSAFTSPIKLFEYMAAGCAIVASDLPAFREVLGESDAEWATPGDPASLAAAIQRLLADPQRAASMGARVREKASGYTWDGRAAKLKKLLLALH